MTTLDQHRARTAMEFAAKCASQSKYATAAERLPVQILLNGLLTVLLHDQPDASLTPVKHLSRWLQSEFAALQLTGGALTGQVAQLDNIAYAVVEEDALAFAQWLKLWTNALAPDTGPRPGGEDAPTNGTAAVA